MLVDSMSLIFGGKKLVVQKEEKLLWIIDTDKTFETGEFQKPHEMTTDGQSVKTFSQGKNMVTVESKQVVTYDEKHEKGEVKELDTKAPKPKKGKGKKGKKGGGENWSKDSKRVDKNRIILAAWDSSLKIIDLNNLSSNEEIAG